MQSFLNDRVVLHPGDCLDVLKTLADCSVDSCVTDPPYHLHSIVKRFAKTGRTESTASKSGPHQRTARGFMGHTWDGGDIAFRSDVWHEVWRVLKPGAYILAFSSSRTFGRMSVAIEDAGFINHPLIGWLFGSGFPKAHRVEAEGYEGWRYGAQSLKPALEPIYMGQKPFSEATGTANVLAHGTGAINVDGCRIESSVVDKATMNGKASKNPTGKAAENTPFVPGVCSPANDLGRFPANLIHDGSPEVLAGFPSPHGAGKARSSNEGTHAGKHAEGWGNMGSSAMRFGDEGSAARFFYSAKADSDDRLGSSHPTVKPVDLMQWLVRLVTPKVGLVLDPFAGTGTTGEAAWREGMRAVLIERETIYQTDIARRMALCLAGPEERARAIIKATQERRGIVADHGPLFEEIV